MLSSVIGGFLRPSSLISQRCGQVQPAGNTAFQMMGLEGSSQPATRSSCKLLLAVSAVYADADAGN
jgi:hypothetical protein